jgi:molybdenum cofactor cytidylyltransferase
MVVFHDWSKGLKKMAQKISAIILSAGFSTRMGRFKPLLPLGDETVIERVIGLFRKAGVGDVRVVVGHRKEELIPLIERKNTNVIINPNYSKGMFSSVQAGVNSVPRDSEAFFIHPVDIPMVYPSTITKIIGRHDHDKGMIIYPCYNGKRGHPPLVPIRFSKAIVRANISGKLNDVLASFTKDSMDLEVEDPNILFGMNHPRDYTAMVAGLDHHSVFSDGQA